jgi:integrase/recombinase XerC/integrase/recombinase XerD
MKEIFPFEQKYIDYLEIERGLAKRTVWEYFSVNRMLSEFLAARWFPDGFGVTEIEEKHVRSFMVYLKKERGLIAKSRNERLSALRSYFGFLEEYGLIREKDNPVRRLRNAKIPRRLPVFFSLEESKAILAAAKNFKFPERSYAMMKMFLQTGCRLDELVKLEVSQIDLKEKYVRFLGKGDKERIVPLLDSTCQALTEYLSVRRPAKPDIKQIFLGSRNGPISPVDVQAIFRGICLKAGIEKENVSVHTLRHTCFTLLLKAGIDIATIKEIAGHNDINTTSIYLHVTQNEVRAAMEKHPFR